MPLHHGLLGSTHFRLQTQHAFIAGHGEWLVVWPALQCPCLLEDRQFDPTCLSCHGTGRLYLDALQYTHRFLLVREHSSRHYEEPGTVIPGTIQMSIPPGVQLAERDKVRRVGIKEVFNDETLERGGDETLRFSGGVELLVVADRERIYQSGRDYVLTTPNVVSWVPGGQAPPFMASYSVRYAAHPDYLITPDSPRSRLEHDVAQSQVVTAMRLDYLQEGL